MTSEAQLEKLVKFYSVGKKYICPVCRNPDARIVWANNYLIAVKCSRVHSVKVASHYGVTEKTVSKKNTVMIISLKENGGDE